MPLPRGSAKALTLQRLPFADNCQCHAGVRKAALPDGRRCGAARRQAKLANRRAELSSRPPRWPRHGLKVNRFSSDAVQMDLWLVRPEAKGLTAVVLEERIISLNQAPK